MPFIGSIINFCAIVIFSILGALINRAIPERVNRGVLSAIAICVAYLGIDGALAAPAEGLILPDTFFGDVGLTKFIVMIISLALGTAIGELIDIDGAVNRLGDKLEKKFVSPNAESGRFSKAFISCTIMTSVGAMAVNGAILDATSDPGILIAKSVIDAIACFVMASSLGIGCAFAAIPMLIYQASLTAVALLLAPVISQVAIYYLSATGSLIIVLIGTNFLGATNVKTANMTPAIFIPFLLTPILNLF